MLIREDMDDALREQMSKQLEKAFARLKAESYYFGFFYTYQKNAKPIRPEVLDRLIEWHKGDPKPWDQRSHKAMFTTKGWTEQAMEGIADQLVKNVYLRRP